MAELEFDNHSLLVLDMGNGELWDIEYYLFNEGDIDWYCLPTWDNWTMGYKRT